MKPSPSSSVNSSSAHLLCVSDKGKTTRSTLKTRPEKTFSRTFCEFEVCCTTADSDPDTLDGQSVSIHSSENFECGAPEYVQAA